VDGGSLHPRAPRPRILYLNFDGATLFPAPVSDAHLNLSPQCGAALPAFDPAPYGAPRAAAISRVTGEVAALFADFGLVIVTRRPAAPPYEMVVIGGEATACGQPAGVPGIAPLDCGDQTPGEIALAFAGTITDLDMLAVVVAHEVAHTFGLVHTMAGCDVMSNYLCEEGRKSFLDVVVEVAPDHAGVCGLHTTNSWEALRGILGEAGVGVGDAGAVPPADGGAVEPADGGSVGADAVGGPPPLPSRGGCNLIRVEISWAAVTPGMLLIVLALGLRRARGTNQGRTAWEYWTNSPPRRATSAPTRNW
jgi:hypothetical protein